MSQSGGSSSKGPGGADDDLLSKLFDSDEGEKTEFANLSLEDEQTTLQKGAFAEKTRIENSPDEQTDASGQSANLQKSSEPAPTTQGSKLIDKLFEDAALTDATLDEATQLSKETLKPSAAADRLSAAFRDVEQSPAPVKAPSSAAEANPFGDLLKNDEPMPDEKIDFFTTGATKKENIKAPAGMDASNAGVSSDKTLVLQKSMEEPSESSETEGDALDLALLDASKSETAPQPRPVDFKAESEISPMPVEVDSGAAEVSKDDFADVFAQEPIQVPSSQVKISPLWIQKARKTAVPFIGTILLLGGLVYVVDRLKSDEGLFGKRLDGFKIVDAYEPPTDEMLKSFEKILKDTDLVFQKDDPKALAAEFEKVGSILVEDERNLEAAAAQLEICGVLMAWYGLASEWAKKFDEAQQKIGVIQSQLKVIRSAEAADRGRAWKAMALGDLERGSKDLEQSLSKYSAPSASTYLLLSEMAWRRGYKPVALNWLQKAEARVNYRRGLWLEALIQDKPEVLAKLASEDYLPAKVSALTQTKITKDQGPKLIDETEQLLTRVKEFPGLTMEIMLYRGDLFQETGDSEKARAEWNEIVKISDKNYAVWMKLAASYEDDAMWADAIKAYQKAQSIGGLNEKIVLRFAGLLTSQNKIVEALTLLESAISANPKSALLHQQKARVQLALYQDDAARESFKKALEFDPKLETAMIGLAEIAIDKQDWAVAEENLRKIPNTSPFYGNTLKSRAEIALIKGLNADAEKLFKEALQVNPKLESIYPQLVEIVLTNGERDNEAEDILRKGLLSLPRSAVLKITLAKVQLFQKLPDEALKTLEPIRKSFEHLTLLQYTLAEIFIEKGEYEDAWKILEPLVAKEVKDPELQYLRSLVFYSDMANPTYNLSPESAQRLAASAAKMNPQSDRYHLLAAKWAVKNADRITAADHLDTILKRNPRYAEAYVTKGDAYLDAGDIERAVQNYELAIQNTRFRASAYRRLAKNYQNLQRPEKAIEYYNKVIQQSPNDAEARLEIGKLLTDAGNFKLANLHLKKAIQIKPNMAEAYYFLGFVQKEMGDRKGALQSFEKFLNLDPKNKEASTVQDEVYFLRNGQAN